MKIIELILDEEQEDSGIEAISIVESPAIESDFVTLNSQDEGEYYIFFSKNTIAKASQMYLRNGYQNNSTLEHEQSLNGLTLVESWIVADEVQDKSRKYGLNVPIGTWMGAVKVNNDEIWEEYVKTNKVKGFSIEGYFADKMERPKETVQEDLSKDEKTLIKIKELLNSENETK